MAKKTDKVLFVKIENDGYDLGAQRRELSCSDIPKVVELIKNFKSALVEGKDFELSEYDDEFAVLAEKEDIKNKDYILVGERYRTKEVHHHRKFPMVELEEVCELNPKKTELHGMDMETKVSFVPMTDLNEHRVNFIPKQTKLLREVYASYTYFSNNDVLLARVTPCFENGKAGIASKLDNGIGFGSSEFFVLRPNTNIVIPTFVYYLISDSIFIRKGKNNMTGTGGLQRLSKDFVSLYKIPLPPISIQVQIVDLVTANYSGDKKLSELLLKAIEREAEAL